MRRPGRLTRAGGLVAVLVTALSLAPAATAGQDSTAPVLTAVTLDVGALHPGDVVPVHIAASDDSGGPVSGLVVWARSDGGDLITRTSAPTTVTAATWDGVYRISSVHVVDASGNNADYFPDGRLVTHEVGVGATTTTHTVDLGAGFSVLGAHDVAPPFLTGVQLVDGGSAAWAPVTVALDVDEEAGSLAQVVLRWSDSTNGQVEETPATDVPIVAGRALATVRPQEAGHLTLEQVTLTDPSGNGILYEPNGTVVVLGGVSKVNHHTLDLGSVSVTLVPPAPGVRVVPRPGRVSLLVGPTVSSPPVTGYHAVFSPGGASVDGPALPGESSILTASVPAGSTASVTVRSTVGDSAPTVVGVSPGMTNDVVAIAGIGDGSTPLLVAQRTPFPASSVLTYATDDRHRIHAGSSMRNVACDRIAAGGDEYQGLVLCESEGALLTAAPGIGGFGVIGQSGWDRPARILGGDDLTGDGVPDVVSVDTAGVMRVYALRSRAAGISRTVVLGGGWGAMSAVVSAGDLTGDRRADLVAVDAAGRMWLYPGNGRSGFGARRQIGSGWAGMAGVLSMRDFDGDGRADLGALTMAGHLVLYRGTGTGALRSGVTIGTGWNTYF